LKFEGNVPDWLTELLKLGAAFLGGASIGSFITIKVTRSNNMNTTTRTVKQSRVNAGRDNIVGDRIDRR